MGGWARLGWILSLIYWAFALFMAWSVHTVRISGVVVGLAVAVYAAVAAICWALSGFARR